MYEISFVFKTEDASALEGILARHGTGVHAGGEVKKVRLAYPLKKNEYGFWGSFRFEAEPGNLEKIFKDLKLEGNLIRYLVTRLEEKKVEARSERKNSQVVPMVGKSDEPRRHQEPALTNEELEKKIEEILQ